MKLNPRITIPGSILVLASLLWIDNWWLLLAGLGLLPAGLRLAGMRGRELRSTLRPFLWLIVLNFLLLLVMPLFGGAQPDAEWLHRALLFSGRLGLILSLSLLFVRLAGPEEMLDCLSALAEFPARLGLPARRWVFTLSLTWRLLPVVREDSRWIHYNLGLDEPQAKAGRMRRLKREVRVLVPLLLNTFERAEDLQTALICRGCLPAQRPVALQESRFGVGEARFLAGMGLWFLLVQQLHRGVPFL